MDIPQPPDDQTPDPAKRPLPPELAFLRDQPDFTAMEAEELVTYLEAQHARIRQHADLIRAHGLDPDKLIAFTEPAVRDLKKSCETSDAADEKMYTAMADSADAQYKLFKAMAAITEQLHAECPFDPDVQELKEFVDEWRQHMPKE